MIPNDPIILLSYINTQLRDNFDNLNDFCIANDLESSEIIDKLTAIGYSYNETTNQFV